MSGTGLKRSGGADPVRTLKGIGWRPVASYFFLFLVFFALAQLYTLQKLNLWGAVTLAFSCSVALAWILYKRVISPLDEMSSVAQDMARGNLDQEIRIFAQDELGDLARSINYMARQLKSNLDDVVAEKNRIQAILSSMADGVIALDGWGRVILINPVVEEIFGISFAGCRGKNILRVIRNNELERILNQALETDRSIQKQVQILMPEPRFFRVHVTPLKGAGQERAGVVALLRDITERKKLEEMRAEFVANVSHELRTPLTSIRGFTETLLDGALEDAAVARQFLEIINTEAERLTRLIDELLNLSKIEDGRAVPNRQPLKMGELIHRAVAILQPRAVEKDLTIKINLPENLPVVQGDPDMISQVLINLIDNAVSYT
ncbi:MAG: cell wall metabolism sensor histidine kinase WalK, partial [Peptococcaceae bacterium]|nr:cell wall metabolism sensor histidine kinase WalK [Peptococcaceae bacterium]